MAFVSMIRACCHLTSVHPPFDVRIFHKECKTLVREGYRVTLIAPHVRDETKDGVRVLAAPRLRNRILRITCTVYRVCILAMRERCDLYHVHDPELLLVGFILKILTGRPVLYDAHEDYGTQMLSKSYLPKPFRRMVALCVGATEQFLARRLDGVISATDDIAKKFHGIKNAVTVKNFPDIAMFPGKISSNRSDGPFQFVYVGSLSEIRGIAEIVEALALVRPSGAVRLALVGKFDSQEYEDRVSRLAGFRLTKYYGLAPYSEIPNVLGNVDAGIVCLYPVPNYLTSLPIKLFEYMAMGLPVIASNFFGHIIERHHCGITVDPKNPQEIAKAMMRFAEYPHEARRMGENGRKAVLEHYDWEGESKKLLQLYERTIRP